MARPKINYDLIERYILVSMYDAYVSDGNPVFSPNRVKGLLDIPTNVIRSSLETLEIRGHIQELMRTREVPDSSIMGTATGRMLTKHEVTGTYKLTNDGRRHVERLPEDEYDLALAAIAAHGGSDVFVVDPSVSLGTTPRWEPLPIERSSVEVASVQAALTDLVQKVQSDNGYAETEPTERAEILGALKAAAEVINTASILSYTSFDIYVATPLTRLAARFGPKTIIGSAVALLWDAVKVWLKKRVGVALDDLFAGE